MHDKMRETRTKMRLHGLPGSRTGRRDAGFTAIEIAMVAAIIAILALIILPIFRGRVEDAKKAAAQSDLASLMKAEMVVKADTDFYARLEDLDNVALNSPNTAPPNGVTVEVPFFVYNAAGVGTPPVARPPLSTAQRTQLGGTADSPKWKGPYVAMQHVITYADAKAQAALPGDVVWRYVLQTQTGNSYQSAIQDFLTATTSGCYDSDNNRIPVDPWGNPYLFFAPTGVDTSGNASPPRFPNCAIYSLGPNGLPGDGGVAPSAAAYQREQTVITPNSTSVLGKGDDLMVQF
jgi:prepilin-type N-terminal cleavage/methylation domain-containing protein